MPASARTRLKCNRADEGIRAPILSCRCRANVVHQGQPFFVSLRARLDEDLQWPAQVFGMRQGLKLPALFST
jgi:hypothetical protein